MAAIQYASWQHVPGLGPSPSPASHTDKLAHAVAYGILALLLARALRGSSRARLGDIALIACIWATAYGGLEELIQRLLERTPDFLDILSNAAGAAIAALAWWGVARRRAHRPSPKR